MKEDVISTVDPILYLSENGKGNWGWQSDWLGVGRSEMQL